MRKTTAITILLFALSHDVFASGCANLGEQLEIDEPRVKEYVQKLIPSQEVEGISLCDGSVLFQGWIFVRKVSGLETSQEVYLFKDGKATRAVAWVTTNGKSFDVPGCPYGDECKSMLEPGLVISGDVYTWKQIRAGEEVVIIWYPPENW